MLTPESMSEFDVFRDFLLNNDIDGWENTYQTTEAFKTNADLQSAMLKESIHQHNRNFLDFFVKTGMMFS